jgi:hypothetical protein
MNSYLKKKATMKDRRESIRRIFLSRTFRVVLSVMMFVVGILYMWQVNTVSAKGYVISDYEKKLTVLERETRSLEVEIARHTSMPTLQTRLLEEEFEPVSGAFYASLPSDAVAKR